MGKKKKKSKKLLHTANIEDVRKDPDAFLNTFANKVVDEVIEYQKAHGIEPIKG